MDIPKHHNLYIIRSFGEKESAIKVGYSSTINSRMRSYWQSNPFTEVLFTCYIEKGLIVEQILHSSCPSRISREWHTESKLKIFLKYLTTYSNDFKFYTAINDYENSTLIPINPNQLDSFLLEKIEKIDEIINNPEYDYMVSIYEILGVDTIRTLVNYINFQKSK